jgi:hypothetical protein
MAPQGSGWTGARGPPPRTPASSSRTNSSRTGAASWRPAASSRAGLLPEVWPNQLCPYRTRVTAGAASCRRPPNLGGRRTRVQPENRRPDAHRGRIGAGGGTASAMGRFLASRVRQVPRQRLPAPGEPAPRRPAALLRTPLSALRLEPQGRDRLAVLCGPVAAAENSAPPGWHGCCSTLSQNEGHHMEDLYRSYFVIRGATT